MQNKNKILATILGMLLPVALLMQPLLSLAATYNALEAYGVDTIAGYSTILRTSKTFPNQDVVFIVKKPEGGTVNISSKTDVSGIAKAELYDFHTRKAGQYFLSVKLAATSQLSPESSFIVYPDEVSADQSMITTSSSLAKADGTSKVTITVLIKDKYGNPFKGHSINLISSRTGDVINKPSLTSTTDQNGTMIFSVTSSEAGSSIYSAVDTTAGLVLNSRVQVAFVNDGRTISDAGAGDNLNGVFTLAAAADAGPIHHFEIGDLPPTINPNTNISFSLTAKDQNNLTVENYTGTVHFSSEGANSSNIILPEDYTFKAENLGTHLFSLGLKFTVAGDYKIIATDISNQLLKGDKSVTVGASGSNTQGAGQKPVISTPTAGTYSQNLQTINGSAPSGMTVKIYDNDQEIGTVQAGQNGSFTFQSSALTDGKHKLHVVTLDQAQTVQGTSDTVEITVDTTAPVVEDITLNPSTDIKPDSVINVNVTSEPNLSQAALIFNNDIITLSPNLGQDSSYLGSIKAPANPGSYNIDVLLSDQLGNEATYQSVAVVNITENGGNITQNTQQQTQETQQETQETQVIETQQVNLPPSQVFGVVAYGSDKKVTLAWEAATDDVVVNNYKIYYGLDPANLDKNVTTKDASTTWYIPNLENGKEYYFSVAALDDQGSESVTRSDIVSAIPFTLESIANVPNKPTGSLVAAGEKPAALEGYVPPEMSKNGPEIVWLLMGSGAVGGVIRKFRKKK